MKCHLLVDTRGTVLVTCVSPASVGDHDGAVVPFSRAADAFPRLQYVWADQGYRGADFHAWARELTGITVEAEAQEEASAGRCHVDGGVAGRWSFLACWGVVAVLVQVAADRPMPVGDEVLDGETDGHREAVFGGGTEIVAGYESGMKCC
ncbi:transposase [Streptomyces sp. NPDC050549]|uniref:transposase n=1 Tax=Streptomyces sp. NPDC050549 TaxID=3155406 RepID=UPI00342C47CE